MLHHCCVVTSTCKLKGTGCAPTSFDSLFPKILFSLCCPMACGHSENSMLITKVCVRSKLCSSKPWERFGRAVLNLLKAVNPFGMSGFHSCCIWIAACHLWLTNKNAMSFGRVWQELPTDRGVVTPGLVQLHPE